MSNYIHHLLKAAAMGGPVSAKPPQPIQPVFQTEGDSSATPAPTGFPAGPQSLNAGAPDESAALAAQAEQQKAQAEEESRKQQAQLELHKTREELLAAKSEQMQQQAQTQAQQAQAEAQTAQLQAQQARTEAQLEAAKARDQLVTEKEKALDQHMKRLDKARQMESRPTLVTSTAERLRKKVEQMGSHMKYAHLAFHKLATVAPPTPALPEKTPVTKPVPTPPITPPTGAPSNSFAPPRAAPVDPERQRRSNHNKIRMQQIQDDMDHADSFPGKLTGLVSNFINDSPDMYKKKFGDNIVGKTLDFGLSRVADPLRELHIGAGDYAAGNTAGAWNRWGRATTSMANTVTAPLMAASLVPKAVLGGGGMTMPGAVTAAAQKIPGVTGMAQNFPTLSKVLGGTASSVAGATVPGLVANAPMAAVDGVNRWAGGEPDATPNRYSSAWQVGAGNMSKEDELMLQDRSRPTQAAAQAAMNPDNLQSLQRTGYHHRDSFMPFQNSRSRFDNPWIQMAADNLGPMIYPQVNMGQYTGQPQQFDPMGRATSMAHMMFPQMTQNWTQ